MRKGSRPETTGTPPRRPPSFNTLAWIALVGSLLLADALRDNDPPQPTATQAGSSPGAQSAPRATPNGPGAQPLPASPPVRIRIPAIKVDAFLTRLELDSEGTLQPPPLTAAALAGWYADGTTPGSPGTAVVAGHVDTPSGPAVFHRLGALKKGAEITVDRQDGRTALFKVDAVEVHAKDDFPDDRVYRGSARPELRLITCGGSWSSSTGYQANTVVYATMNAVK
ncbi:class F sortase [Streptomyces sp. NBC_01353]|uniref:class F sortase n=1 Tax=Streptomyces sp. NBC_01353 TaxID=2903835 RepID=UPI002E366B00|nr:class F sortase [Streptomyces sp. NBC_01353]